MFRTKKPKVADAGALTRKKRKEIDADSDNDNRDVAMQTIAPSFAAPSERSKPTRRRRAAVDDDDDGKELGLTTTAPTTTSTTTTTGNSDDAMQGATATLSSHNNVDSNAPSAMDSAIIDNDNASDDEAALLEHIRSRTAAQRVKTATSSFSTFRSRGTFTSRTVPSTSTSTSSNTQPTNGALSFGHDDLVTNSRKTKRSAIRPNLLAASIALAALSTASNSDNDNSSSNAPGAYSLERLAALRREQNVLLPTTNTSAELIVDTAALDEQLDGATIVLDDSTTTTTTHGPVPTADAFEDDAEDEFIPLTAQVLHKRKKRASRVTFGVDVDDDDVPFAKTTQVVEPIDDRSDDNNNNKNDAMKNDASDSDDDSDAKQERQAWEDELLRRGGFHVHAAATAATTTRPRTGRATYPTHRRVATATLADVLSKLQRSFDAATTDNDRAVRDVARIAADAQLLETHLATQKTLLTTASVAFEAFQDVEDFCCGLSFCLRAKLPTLVALEQTTLQQRVEIHRKQMVLDATRAQAIVAALGATNALVPRDAVVQGRDNVWHALCDGALLLQSVDDADAAVLQRGFTDAPAPVLLPQAQPTRSIDLFADAVDGMSSITNVATRFTNWRESFPDLYASCYCDVALETLYAPFVRAELLMWDPLRVAIESDRTGAWRFESFEWLNVLQQQHPSTTDASAVSSIIRAQIRDVVLPLVTTTIDAAFDPFASLHTRSVIAFLDAMRYYAGGALATACSDAIERLVERVTHQFVDAAKRVTLIALSDNAQSPQARSSSNATVLDFATYELARFTALLDNALTFFVAMPRDDVTNQRAGFRSVMQLLHALLAYVRYCAHVNKEQLVPQAVATAAQLTTSPYLQQLLASSAQEQELQRVLTQLAPFCHTT